jgi:hypothetical protein
MEINLFAKENSGNRSNNLFVGKGKKLKTKNKKEKLSIENCTAKG